ncbi:outer mitochondrial membrane isoform [Scheffersomyces xylosifermentans]|uniref:outer mitochondrial membrane isoform n=1 Tax=Scheffersomyces xylosifermentans TaxID=1304137 RepID=UPI00315CED2E
MATINNTTEKYRPRQLYSLQEVRKHDTPKDLWMVIYNRVYDVTAFAGDHPGGVEVLFDCGGVDATEAFEDVAHSDDAVNMLAPYFLGDLDRSDHRSYTSERHPKDHYASMKEIRPIPRKRKSKHKQQLDKAFIEKVTIGLLVCLAVISIIIYVCIQKFKWAYHV